MTPFGNDYVEYDTRVIIRGAENTLTAFQPAYYHGSTASHKVRQIGVAMTSSKRVYDVYKKAVNSGGIDRTVLVGARGKDESDDDTGTDME